MLMELSLARKRKHIYFSPITDEGHVFCCASSGAGKTSAIAIPSVFAPLVKIQIEGLVFALTFLGIFLLTAIFPNKLIFDIEDSNTTPYNIFYSIDSEPTYEIKNELLEKLAYLIMPELSENDEAGSFFLKNGRSMLIGALIAYYHQGLDFIPICQKSRIYELSRITL